MKVVKTKGILKKLSIIFMLLILIMASYLSIKQSNVSNTIFGGNSELLRAMTYDQFEDGDEKVEGTDNVEFSAFFLRDVDGDGYAEKIKGTCKEIGKTDTLYLELNVLTEGKVKNGKIEINGQNFNFVTALPKDEELKDNYISNNTEVIEFNEFGAGKQKLLTGMVQSGDYSINSQKISALGNTINNYSRDDNKIILTGTYVDGSGNETEIRKEITLNMDWYGITKTKIEKIKQTSDLPDKIDEENGTLNLSFELQIHENQNELILSKNYVEGTIPELNGYKPLSVTTSSNKIDFSYNDTTGKFIIINQAEIDDNGIVTKNAYTNTTSDGKTKYNKYTINVTYPLDSYLDMDADTVTINIPIISYYEGYNNPNSEFTNPYKSNEAREVIIANYENPKGDVAKFEIKVGKYVNNPNSRYVISKEKPLKLYNGLSESEENDQYEVYWYGYTGTNGATNGLIMKETANGAEQVVDQFIKTDSNKISMENVTTNVGIGFEDVEKLINDDGWIKVYDEETENLLVTFTANGENGTKKWSEYTKSSPYYYEVSVKHIRVETSETMALGSIKVYNIKELDDEYITQNYTPEEFESLSHIQSQIVGYIGGIYVNTAVNQAKYEEPYSVAKIELSQKTISTQETEENEIITITADSDINANRLGWRDGCFLVKLPDEILDVEINNILINNSKVEIVSSEVLQNESGRFIKINTANRDGNAQNYKITIDANLTANPRISTVEKIIELYASNEETKYYYYNSADIYDVNDNLNTEELVNKTTTSINLISPNSILTNQTMQLEDEQVSSEIVISPKVLELRPLYDNDEQEKQEVKIGIQLKNNYSHTISEIQILGKIPFEGNKYVISQKDLKSEFSTTMKSSGIEIPNDLIEYATIYYSENENPSRDIDNSSNGWKRTEDVTDWTKIKSYTIDLGEKLIDRGVEYTFYYTVIIPNGIDLNKTAYSHHGIYFCLDTNEGKYRTQTEPKKVGVSIADKFNLELTKYQKDREKTISGATYKISKLDEDGNVEETCTATTKANGKLEIGNLYAEKIYKIEEIKSPADYKLNNDIIKFIGHVDEDGVLTIEKLAGTTKGNITVTRQTGENYKANIFVEDEVNVKLKIIKTDKDTNEPINSVRYKITGEGLRAGGKILTTDTNGEASLNGLIIGEEYTIEETKAEGYYLSNPIVFKVINNNGTYEKTVTDDESVKETTITEDESIPTINIKLTDEKIPTYDLVINKIEKGTGVDGIPAVSISGVKFKLYKDTVEIGTYVTDSNGNFTINNLYQYEENKDLNQTYVLKEIYAPEGYAKIKDIIFKGSVVEGNLTLVSEQTDNYTAIGTTINLIIEDSPSFKLIKKDGETNALLPNVKFAIYNVDVGETPARDSKGKIIGTREVIDGREYYTVTTNANGELTADLPEGIYKAVEVEADEKYNIDNKVEYFGIGESREGKSNYYIDYAMSIGANEDFYIESVCGAKDGGYYVGGYFSGPNIQIGEFIITNSGDKDGVIIKYDKEGIVEWVNKIGGSNTDYIYSVSETTDGGCVVGGYYKSTNIQLGDFSLTNGGNTDGMIIKYNNYGVVEWVSKVGKNGADHIRSVYGTSDGGCIVGGNFGSSSIEIGEYTLTNGGNTDGFLIKYDSLGVVKWANRIGGSNKDYIYGLCETETGDYIAGGVFYSSSFQVGEYSLTNNGGADGMIIKYSRTGGVLSANSIGGNKDDTINSVCGTIDGGYIVGGAFKNSIQLGSQTLTNRGSYNTLVIKYTSQDEIEWVNSVQSYDENQIFSVCGTTDGGCTAVGNFKGDSINVGTFFLKRNESLLSSSDYNGMIIKYSSDGIIERADSLIGRNSDTIRSVSTTSDGGYIVGGCFKSANVEIREYALNNYSSTNYYDGVLIKYSPVNVPDVKHYNETVIEGYTGRINSSCKTRDGGYIVAGRFTNESIQFGEYTLYNSSPGDSDGMIIKYNNKDEVEWVNKVGGSYEDSICSVCETIDGGYIAGGYFGSNIQLGEHLLTHTSSSSYANGMLIKYSKEGEIEWTRTIEGEKYYNSIKILSVSRTNDGGIIVGGSYNGSIQLGEQSLTNSYSSMIIKYSSKGEVEWANSAGGSIISVCQTGDDGYIAGGYFSSNIQLGEYTLTSNGLTDGMIIKYSRLGEVEWANSVGGKRYEEITSVCGTPDGGCVVSGDFEEGSLHVGNTPMYSFQVEDYTITTNGKEDGIIIKYSGDGKIEWINSLGGNGDDHFEAISSTSDGGYVVGGYLESKPIYLNKFMLSNSTGSSYCDGMIIKYNSNGEVQWMDSVCGEYDDCIYSVCETIDGNIIAVGNHFGNSLNNSGNYSGFIRKVNGLIGANEQEEIMVENSRKEYIISTDINKIDGIKGGAVSGEYTDRYEIVKYGDSSSKEIKMIPDSGYEIIEIKVNGEEWQYTALPDGSYIMPQFTNVTEDKHIVVTYSLKDNKIKINKKDSVSGAALEGAQFRLDQIEERSEPNNEIIGTLTDNGTIYVISDYDKEVVGFIDLDTNLKYVEGVSHHFVPKTNEDNSISYVPTNSKTWQTANIEGATTGVQNTTANSYVEIDLSEMTGTYKVVVNGYVSSQSGSDYGYATITTNADSIVNVESIPKYNTTASPNSRFIYLSGTYDNSTIPRDRESALVLNGGEKYYLHLGYYKNASIDNGEDQFVINSLKLYETKNVQYNFKEVVIGEGDEARTVYQSTNEGTYLKTANSYIPIDLTTYTGKYNLTVNADVSTTNGDYGYVTLNTTESPAPDSNLTASPNRRIIYETSIANDEKTIEIDGGYLYYLHLGYYKDDALNTSGEDYFRVNSINISLSDSQLYHTTVETNSSGQAITQIPFGKYQITEIETQEGYVLTPKPVVKDQVGNIIDENGIIEFRSTDGALHEFTIENEKYAHVIVHHYIKDTTTKLADDEYKEGKQGENYSTIPKVGLTDYELEEVNGELVLPNNQTGQYTYDDIEVIFYYVRKKIPLTINHFIDGTNVGVPLKAGGNAESIIQYGNESDSYNTTAIADELLDDRYELVAIPENSSGIYGGNEIIINYYYKEVVRELTINKTGDDGGEPLSDTVFNVKNQNNTIFGNIKNNGTTYTTIEYDSLINNNMYLGDLTNNGTYYFIDDGEGKLVPTNSKKWQIANVDGATTGVQNVTANSYIKVDLSGVDGKYVVVLNAHVSSQSSYDYGYATINQSTTAPAYSSNTSTNKRFMYISGNTTTTRTDTDYVSSILEGGKIYYLHLGYRKNANTDTGDDQVVINSINLHPATEIHTSYYFEYDNGKFKSNNQYKDNTVANSYIPIDLRGKTGEHELIVNASVSSASGDYGYLTVNQSTNAPSYSANNSSNVRFAYITENQTAQNYSTTLEGGRLYYLHMGYYKNTSDSSGTDTFTINSIKVGEETFDRYVVKTDNSGKATVALKNGTYEIVETESPAGYKLNSDINTLTINRDSGVQTLNITNQKTRGKVIVHHYIKNTTRPVLMEDGTTASDVIKEDIVGEMYATKPLDDISHLFEYVGNTGSTSGEYIDGTIVVTYYYDYKDSTVTVHHYIEGTTTSLSDDVTITGKITSHYETNTATDIPEYYELVAEPTNKNGEITFDPITVNYEYRLKKYPYIVNYYKVGTTDKLQESKNGENKTYGTNILAADEEIDIYGYKIVGHSTDELTIGVENNVINIYYDIDETQKKTLSYRVEYYKDNVIVSDDTQTMEKTVQVLEPDILTVNKTQINTSNKYPGYIFQETDPEQIPDTINSGSTIKVYYEINTGLTYTVNYLESGKTDPIKPAKLVGNQQYGHTIDTSTEVIDIEGFTFKEVNNPQLIISDNDSENVINITYDRNTYPYEIRYYYGDDIDDDATIRETAPYGDEINYTLKDKVGYKFDHASADKLTIGVTNNILNVYYELDDSQIVTYKYYVEYYKDGVLQERIPYSKTVHILDNPRIWVNKNAINTTNKFEGYVLVNTVPNVIPDYADDGDVIEVHFTLRSDLMYIVNYFEKNTDNEISPSKVVDNQIYGAIIDANTEAKVIDGFTFDSAEAPTITIGENTQENVINLRYTRNSYPYEIHYFYDGIEDESLAINGTALYESIITAETHDRDGYVLNPGTDLSMQIGTDDNILNINYVIDSTQTKEISYSVEYYKDGTLTDKDISRKTVQLLDDETIEVDKSGIDKNKYFGYTYLNTEPESIPDTVTNGSVIKVYYVASDSVIIINYKIENTDISIKEPDIISGKVGQEYTLPDPEIPDNYEIVTRPDLDVIPFDINPTEVTYEVRVKTPTIVTEFEKGSMVNGINGNTTLTKEDMLINYHLEYNINIEDYIGDAIVEIVDKLPFEIDESKSDIDAGTYNSSTKEIKWTETIENINTFINGEYNMIVTKDIVVVYENIDVTKTIVNVADANVVTYYPTEYNLPEENNVLEEKDNTSKNTINQEYKTNVIIEVTWDDHDDYKKNRPDEVLAVVTGTDGYERTITISSNEEWKYTIDGLPKYDSQGNEIVYTIHEEEKNTGDLEHYKEPIVSHNTTQDDNATNINVSILNEYVLKDSDLGIKVEMTGDEEINELNQPVEYNIEFTADTLEFMGDGEVVIVDYLPYHIDPDKSDLDGGDYDSVTNTITWVEKTSDNLDIKHTIKVVYTDIDYTEDTMKNEVTAKISLYDEDIKDEASDEVNTRINVKGTITIKYIDEYTKNTIIEDTIISDKIGTQLDISKHIKELEGYKVLEINPQVVITEENQTINIYYKRSAMVSIKFVEVGGLEILNTIKKMGVLGEMIMIDDNTKLDGYTLVKAPASNLVLLDSDEVEVVYYFAKNTSIIVRYVDSDLNKELINSITIDGYDGKEYTTERKEFVGYTFKEVKGTTAGKMNLSEAEVVYYYTKYVPEVHIDISSFTNDNTNTDNTYSTTTYENVSSKGIDNNSSNNKTNNANTYVSNNNANTNTNTTKNDNKQIIAVANTGKNANPMNSVIGGVLVVFGATMILVFKKKKYKKFYV